jgi:nucleotide-binding universal stress UspA family protein
MSWEKSQRTARICSQRRRRAPRIDSQDLGSTPSVRHPFAARDLRSLPWGRAHCRPWKESAVREIDHILCPVDLSSVSKAALAHAFAWADWYGTELHVLHVAPIPVAVPGMPGVVVTLDRGSLVRTQLEVQHFVQEVRLAGVPYDVRVLHGDPAAVIVDDAKRYRNALVILGSRASRGLERVMPGVGRRTGAASDASADTSRIGDERCGPVGGAEIQANPLRRQSSSLVARGASFRAVNGHRV